MKRNKIYPTLYKNKIKENHKKETRKKILVNGCALLIAIIIPTFIVLCCLLL